MRSSIALLASFLVLLRAYHAQHAQHAPKGSRSFVIQDNKFVKDGTPFQIVSGEILYSRIPRDYWRDRLMRLKSLGLNAIQTYVPWNFHESVPGQFDFSGWRNLTEFIQLAADTELLVLLRPGPYICAEWDFGGFPAWLLSKNLTGRDLQLRTSDPLYLHFVQRWWSHLFAQLAPFTYSQGGPIIMSQIENEYGFYGYDKKYLRFLLNMTRTYLGEDITIYTTDTFNPGAMARGTLVGSQVLSVVDFPPATDLQNAFAIQRFFNAPGMSPPFCAEFYTGWLSHWGEPMANTSTDILASSLRDLLQFANSTASVSLYMGHGGTNFGFWAGANIIHSPLAWSHGQAHQRQVLGTSTTDSSAAQSAHAGYLPGVSGQRPSGAHRHAIHGADLFDFDLRDGALHDVDLRDEAAVGHGFDVYLPHITSYDYDCPIGEAGTLGQVGIGGRSKFEAIREVLSQHFNATLPPPLPDPPLAGYGQVALTRSVLLLDVLDCMTPQGPITAAFPEPMEEYAQSFGFIAYRTTLPNGTLTRGALLSFTPHDLAIIFIGQSPVGYIWRNSRQPQLSLPATFEDIQLTIVVEAMGRNNFGTGLYQGLMDRKGLVTNVTLDGDVLKDWEVLTLPMDNLTCVTQPPDTAASHSRQHHPHTNPTDEDTMPVSHQPAQPASGRQILLPHSVSTQSADPRMPDRAILAHPQQPSEHETFQHRLTHHCHTEPTPAPLLAPPLFLVGGFTIPARYRQHRKVDPRIRHLTEHVRQGGSDTVSRPGVSWQGQHDAQHLSDTFLNMQGWGKGVVWVNGHNLGRYWESRGPQNTLYVPGPWLKYGWNEVVVLELMQVPSNRSLTSQDAPDFHNM